MYKHTIGCYCMWLSVAFIQQQNSGSNNCSLFAIAPAYHKFQGDNYLDHIIPKWGTTLYVVLKMKNWRRFLKSKELNSHKRPERFSSIVITIIILPLSPPWLLRWNDTVWYVQLEVSLYVLKYISICRIYSYSYIVVYRILGFRYLPLLFLLKNYYLHCIVFVFRALDYNNYCDGCLFQNYIALQWMKMLTECLTKWSTIVNEHLCIKKGQ